MTLKNRTSKGRNTFEKIQNILAENGAKKVMFDYAGDGSLESISFVLKINGELAGFRLPALVENVIQILYGGEDRHGREKKITDIQRMQGYNTAWANIRDWIDAQMALVKTRQVEVAQVFLPYLIMRGGKTLYDQVISDPKFLLGDGN